MSQALFREFHSSRARRRRGPVAFALLSVGFNTIELNARDGKAINVPDVGNAARHWEFQLPTGCWSECAVAESSSNGMSTIRRGRPATQTTNAMSVPIGIHHERAS